MRGMRYLGKVAAIAAGFTVAVIGYLSGCGEPVDLEAAYGVATVGVLVGIAMARH